eukprot:4099579-Prymnesium_polylepis.1
MAAVADAGYHGRGAARRREYCAGELGARGGAEHVATTGGWGCRRIIAHVHAARAGQECGLGPTCVIQKNTIGNPVQRTTVDTTHEPPDASWSWSGGSSGKRGSSISSRRRVTTHMSRNRIPFSGLGGAS